VLLAVSWRAILYGDHWPEQTMKITNVEPLFIAVPYEHGGPKQMRPLGPWTLMEVLFVRVDTDAGLTGWGEAFGFAAVGGDARSDHARRGPALHRARIH
jgi:L-alanine-DL-glutamate epimerase-like enolase superfamily enzyme